MVRPLRWPSPARGRKLTSAHISANRDASFNSIRPFFTHPSTWAQIRVNRRATAIAVPIMFLLDHSNSKPWADKVTFKQEPIFFMKSSPV
ncbi:hypothetical protein BDN72DRAFT_374338 [Pluteus cervinus]|uniref:Uncharacterized protein n=1 Tax=Pluteus cervinus TaxID=181527 RepID=A0ACD3B2H1_9AGAR|nr:hypothetical protein BDN72DRAFT_374338 [Pluteus cervinus]